MRFFLLGLLVTLLDFILWLYRWPAKWLQGIRDFLWHRQGLIGLRDFNDRPASFSKFE